MDGAENESFRFETALTLVGGGPVDADMLRVALARAPRIAAADGGADALARLGHVPELIIGDMDSVSDAAAWRARGARTCAVSEQDSSDLEKCLRLISAPMIIGIGFLGGRFDHSLAAAHALLGARMADRTAPVILLSEDDCVFVPPLRWQGRVGRGARVSLFPVAPCRAAGSTGLRWPLHGLAMTGGAQIGTSNVAVDDEVTVEMEGPGAVMILAASQLDVVIASFGSAAA